MANIQPFDYQKSTNIEEHNQIVNKVNEIVQVINDVNLDTINSEIANLKANATATDTEIANIKNKDSAQDTEINGITKSLVSNVTATFDNPSRELKISLGREVSPSIDATVVIPASSETGQYSAGNGISIENYQIAVDTNVVALKTDITNITNKNTEQDTAINGKVAIAQGVENAGKVLGIGSDGNVTPVDAGGSSGGEDWVEVDLSNWPTDWVAGDKIRIYPNVLKGISVSASSWTSEITVNNSGTESNIPTVFIEFSLVDDSSSGEYIYNLMETSGSGYARVQHFLSVEPYFSNFNNLNTKYPLAYMVYIWNGHTNSRLAFNQYTTLSAPNKIIKMLRKRA